MRTHIATAIALAGALSACGPNTTKGQLLQHFDQIEAEAEATHQYVIETYNEYEAKFQELAGTCPERVPERPKPGELTDECHWSIRWNLNRKTGYRWRGGIGQDVCEPAERKRGCSGREYVQWMIEATTPRCGSGYNGQGQGGNRTAERQRSETKRT